MKFLMMLMLVIVKPSVVYGDVFPFKKVVVKGVEPRDTSGHEKLTRQEQLEAIDNHERNENDRDNEKNRKIS